MGLSEHPRKWLHAQCSSSATEAMFACICIRTYMFGTCVTLHVQRITGLVSVWHERNFSYVKALWCHFWSDGTTSTHPWQINTARLRTVWGLYV